MRSPDDLAAPRRWAATLPSARCRACARKIATAEVPVLFESTVAAGLIGALVQAPAAARCITSRPSCSTAWARKCWPRTSTCTKTRTCRGQGQRALDDEGVVTPPRDVVSAGVLQGYFLSSYSARKLGMRTTGHAGGSQNLRLPAGSPSRRRPRCDAEKLGRGLFVIELMGQGVNPVTGDYSRGAAGFWVEGGRIVHPVHEVTIAGHLRATCSRASSPSVPMFTRAGPRRPARSSSNA